MFNTILFTSLFGHMPREGVGMRTEENKKSLFTSTNLTFFFYANSGIRIFRALLSHSTIVSKYSMPNLQCL